MMANTTKATLGSIFCTLFITRTEIKPYAFSFLTVKTDGQTTKQVTCMDISILCYENRLKY